MHTSARTLSRRSGSRMPSARTNCWSAGADGAIAGASASTTGAAFSAESTRRRFEFTEARGLGPPNGASTETGRLEFADSVVAGAVGMAFLADVTQPYPRTGVQNSGFDNRTRVQGAFYTVFETGIDLTSRSIAPHTPAPPPDVPAPPEQPKKVKHFIKYDKLEKNQPERYIPW